MAAHRTIEITIYAAGVGYHYILMKPDSLTRLREGKNSLHRSLELNSKKIGVVLCYVSFKNVGALLKSAKENMFY